MENVRIICDYKMKISKLLVNIGGFKVFDGLGDNDFNIKYVNEFFNELLYLFRNKIINEGFEMEILIYKLFMIKRNLYYYKNNNRFCDENQTTKRVKLYDIFCKFSVICFKMLTENTNILDNNLLNNIYYFITQQICNKFSRRAVMLWNDKKLLIETLKGDYDNSFLISYHDIDTNNPIHWLHPHKDAITKMSYELYKNVIFPLNRTVKDSGEFFTVFGHSHINDKIDEDYYEMMY